MAIVGIKGIDLFFIPEKVILSERHIGVVIVQTVTRVGKRCFRTCREAVTVTGKDEIECRRDYIYRTALILIIIKLRAGDYFSCRQVAFRIKIEECIGLVFQIIDIPYHLVSFISP